MTYVRTHLRRTRWRLQHGPSEAMERRWHLEDQAKAAGEPLAWEKYKWAGAWAWLVYLLFH